MSNNIYSILLWFTLASGLFWLLLGDHATRGALNDVEAWVQGEGARPIIVVMAD
jgi:hypothetical protein